MVCVHTSPLATLGGEKTGGMNVYVRDFSAALAQQGIAVDIFTRGQAPDQPTVVAGSQPGVRVIHIVAGPQQPAPVSEVEHYLDEFAAGVLAFAQHEGVHYDLIHAHYWLSGMVAEQLRQVWGAVPVVQMFHTLGHMKNRVAQSERELASAARLAGEARVVQRADRLIAATPAEQAQLIDLYGADPAKIVVLPPGVDLTRFQPMPQTLARDAVGLARQQQHILFAGRIEPLKGIDTLLQAVALLQRHHPALMEQTDVTIIGGDTRPTRRDAEMIRLQELRCRLDLCHVVGFAGAKDQDLLPAYFAAADLVVMPSLYESFGLVALEAMAMGTPVIAADVGGLAHLVQDGRTGFHFPPRDAEALATRICLLLADPELRQCLGQQARLHARQYDWTQIAQRMIHSVYLPALRARPVAGVPATGLPPNRGQVGR
jgi:D-inositol-3-phosphate glycosyltransferase